MVGRVIQAAREEDSLLENNITEADKEWLESISLVEDVTVDKKAPNSEKEVVDAKSVESDIEKSETTFTAIVNQSYIDMDKAFLQYLNTFIEDVKSQEELKLELKRDFFYWILFFMGAVIVFPYIMMFLFRSQITDVSIVALSITSLAETLSAIIVLPKIIAKYLFNKKEDDNKIKIISRMQKYNKGKRYIPRDE